MPLSMHFKNNGSAFATEWAWFAWDVFNQNEQQWGQESPLPPGFHFSKRSGLVAHGALDLQGTRALGWLCRRVWCFFAYLSIFGFQPELCPACGLQAAGLGVDLDALGSLHHQSTRGRLQPATHTHTHRGYTALLLLLLLCCTAAPLTLLMCSFSPAFRGKGLCTVW